MKNPNTQPVKPIKSVRSKKPVELWRQHLDLIKICFENLIEVNGVVHETENGIIHPYPDFIWDALYTMHRAVEKVLGTKPEFSDFMKISCEIMRFTKPSFIHPSDFYEEDIY